MSIKEVDLVVIGAGATGASIAFEAVKRGLKVALLDAGDISGATSCRSTKLLHGGVRYLELAFKTLDIAQLKLVREALLERSYWLQQVPFLAHQLELVLPSENAFQKAYHQIGLGLYDGLSGNKSLGRSRRISSMQLQEAIPFLRKGARGGVVYSDGQFNDARLNILLALTAEKAGAVIRNYCKVIGFEYKSNGEIKSVISQGLAGVQERWYTNSVVNAAGVNVDTIRKMADPNIDTRIITSRGTHIVLEENLCPASMGVLLPSIDNKRVLFMLPFFGRTLVGTTDELCEKAHAYKASSQEIDYLINHLKEWFPRMKEPTIKSCWAGGRPLLKPTVNNINTSRVVREHEIEKLPCGLISAMGGKWTTCRPIAIDTIKALFNQININLPLAKDIPVIGAHTNSSLTKSILSQQRVELKNYLPKTDLIEKQLDHLQMKYGIEAVTIIANSKKENRDPLSRIIPLCQAEIEQDIKHEYARTPMDILGRRSRLAMVDLPEAQRLLPKVQEELVKSGLNPGGLHLET